MMIKLLTSMLFLSSAVILAMTSTAYGITNGGPDNGEHPYVGLMVADDASGNPLWRCSGTLISPTVFVTAGHCTEPPAARASIWFDEDIDAGMPGNDYPFTGEAEGTTYVHPLYDPTAFLLYDLGVVVLDAPMVMSEYGTLPEVGQLDALLRRRGRQDTTFKAVGYGLQRINPVFIEAFRVRLQATLNLVTLKGVAGGGKGVPPKTSIWLTANANTGGTCFGDSGGPIFADDSTTIVAVTSYGLNGNCAGIGAGFRIDKEVELEWLNTFLP
jgi:hypothetical protein